MLPDVPHDVQNVVREFDVTEAQAGQRLDRVLAGWVPVYSRSQLARHVEEGAVVINGNVCATPSRKVRTGDRVCWRPPPPAPSEAVPETLPLDIVFEDEDLVVVNKAAGMVVHPAAGHASGTLVNAMLAHVPKLAGVGGVMRPGIVHRLDKDTSGVMVVAKNDQAMAGLSSAFKAHAIERRYEALCFGSPMAAQGRMESLHGRDPHNRKRFSDRVTQGKKAVTNWRCIERLSGGQASLMEASLETGRTHQVRVHMSSMGLPLVADALYGRPPKSPVLKDIANKLGRQALHARVLGFAHPVTGVDLRFECPMPPDMALALASLQDVGVENGKAMGSIVHMGIAETDWCTRTLAARGEADQSHAALDLGVCQPRDLSVVDNNLAGPILGFTTRRGGVSKGPFASLNMGFKWGDAPDAVSENRERVRGALGGPVYLARQVHGSDVLLANGDGCVAPGTASTSVLPEADAVITLTPGTFAGVLVADCVPVLVWDTVARACAAVHAGWRGTAANIVGKTVRTLVASYGCRAENLRVVIGPHIRNCCFQVGVDVARTFQSLAVDINRSDGVEDQAGTQIGSGPGRGWVHDRGPVRGPRQGGFYVDLETANRELAIASGVLAQNIWGGAPCTHCHPDDFFSYRRDGSPTGLQMGFIGFPAE